VASSNVSPGDIVLDIGAGTGALTLALVEAGARVVAVELHDERVRILRERFEGERVIVVRADASDLRLPRQPFRVVSNPPFAITTSLIRRLVAPGSQLIRADLVVPLHAAERWASPGAPGAGRWRGQFQVSYGPRLPRRAFAPPATTHTVVLRIEALRVPARSVRPPTSGRRHRHGRPRPRAPSSNGLETLAQVVGTDVRHSGG
jgi:23S rRNA (adenine-N6)-dimethyltransferase